MQRHVRISAWAVVALALCLSVAGCREAQGPDATHEAPASSTSPRPEASPTVAETESAPSPTPTATEPTPTPTATASRPSPTPTPDVVDVVLPCGPYLFGHSGDFNKYFLEWTADDQHLVFNRSRTILVVDAEGTRLRTIAQVGGTSHHPPRFGVHASVSPDSQRVVYSTCEYETESLEIPHFGWDGREKFEYELAVVGLDGSSPQRLTENEYRDHYPSWSPDGSQLAFYVDSERTFGQKGRLFTMSPNGSNVSQVAALERVALYPPVWSPDGRRLAFLANEGDYVPFTRIVYTVRAGWLRVEPARRDHRGAHLVSGRQRGGLCQRRWSGCRDLRSRSRRLWSADAVDEGWRRNRPADIPGLLVTRRFGATLHFRRRIRCRSRRRRSSPGGPRRP